MRITGSTELAEVLQLPNLPIQLIDLSLLVLICFRWFTPLLKQTASGSFGMNIAIIC
jgi:hypothetical protein